MKKKIQIYHTLASRYTPYTYNCTYTELTPSFLSKQDIEPGRHQLSKRHDIMAVEKLNQG